VLSCDFIPPSSIPLAEMLNRWRLDTEGMILSTLFYEPGDDAAKSDGRVSSPDTPSPDLNQPDR